ncbi:MAG TPA: response regulator, partial [Spongiibacteraceae bacterium]|nr:response regulator [Spongiibacteraceae bacterium]
IDATEVDSLSVEILAPDAVVTDATALDIAGGEALQSYSETLPKDAGDIEAAAASSEFLPADRSSEDEAAKVLAFSRPKAVAEPFIAPSLRQAESLRATESLPELSGVSQQLRRGPQEVVKISAQLLEQLVNLAGETSIARGRAEEQVNEFVFSLDEMQITVDRLHEQVRRLDLETEAQMLFRQEQVESEGLEGFDPLEFDRYSLLQQLSRSLLESASDLIDIKNTLAEKSRDMETLLTQQSRINTELQEGLMRSRMVPFARMVPRLRRIVRQVAGELDKQVEFYVDNAEGELDRTVLERIVAPLEHMLRNALDHGLEPVAERIAADKPAQGTIVLSVTREGGDVVLTLTDDGRGIDLAAVRTKAIARGLMDASANLSDHEVMQFILQSGFSTAKQITQISGRGVGMDVVYSEIKQLGGNLEIDSAWGKGSRFTIRLPFTVSVNRALMVSGCGDVYAIPLNTIEGIVRVSPFELEAYYQPDAPLFEYAGQPYLMRYIGALLRTGDKPNLEGHTTPLPVLLVRGSDHAVAIQVDSLMGSREIVVKTLGPQFGLVQGLSGATVLGDGSVVVILDLMAMIRADASHLHRDLMLGQEEIHVDRDRPLLVMVVDDSVTVRKVTSRFLERQGMEVILAKDGVDAINLLQDSDRIPDVMLLDIEMPRMDGFEVASRVRHSSRLRHLPIIMITSRTGDKHRERASALGVDKYLGKPYQETLLLETIHELTGAVTSV